MALAAIQSSGRSAFQSVCEASKNWGCKAVNIVKDGFSYSISKISTCAKCCLGAVQNCFTACYKKGMGGLQLAKSHPWGTAAVAVVALLVILNSSR